MSAGETEVGECEGITSVAVRLLVSEIFSVGWEDGQVPQTLCVMIAVITLSINRSIDD